ncbi:MAG TPA: preprotein translocase subunit SecA [Hypericibacter adhaerens]|uniref:Protein translocase subunit SecA n=1 Tax=Hypericibacter adhaerens TaxID=2602016 RepID=A0A5J6N5Y7_9PROT|nr:preprotein translocase subunit SecA [Hypericibacter adhaerens]QEX24305.1 protein translocase subunit SecA [Hypericibacter adhaerens]HWA43031.1 preprotein translocase subunit SecA [Hypericibacter adhaerens]
MLSALAKRLFGSANDRFIKTLSKTVQEINALEPQLKALDDEGLKARTGWLKERLEKGESLDDILPDAFATVREAAWRVLGQRHFDVQLMGGIVLHRGMIAEMRTGEGKTLVATLPVYLNALSGKGVHVVTVNDYLARRDAEWMGQIYRFLGLTVGCIVHGLSDPDRQQQYAADVTYGTNNELGFDYLRDNLNKYDPKQMVQRDFNYAIVDEVDSILIDEARTPLIISGPTEDSSELYIKIDALIPHLVAADYELDEKARQVTLTEPGVEHMEQLLKEVGLLRSESMYDIQNVALVHHSQQALKAYKLFQRDRDYIVKDNKVIIIDEFTGRMMEGRRYSEGLHQALEAKERVQIQNENQTLASITFQNYFRLYPKLAGMTGTAMTEAPEFSDIYNLDVIEIPTNLPTIRKDDDDQVFRTAKEKYTAIIDSIIDARTRKQPVLVGTASIEKSELLSSLLKQRHIPHQVLNARYHEQEAYIIAEAGVPGAVTIATNMAGRGTDIQLGGNVEMRVRQETEGMEETQRQAKIEQIKAEVAAAKKVALEAGGLYVLGTERHESRRIDNQLRGRSGRQGDPGASRFYLSLEDDLMRIFGSERMDSMLQKLGLKEGEAIVHSWVNKALEKAQQKVEARNFEIRKNLLKYDNVMNDQRKVIYEQRRELMKVEAPELAQTIADMRHETIQSLVDHAIPKGSYPEQWEMRQLHEEILRVLALDLPVEAWAKEEGIDAEQVLERLTEASDKQVAEREERFGPERMRFAERSLLLQILDHLWKEHLLALDHLRHGIGLRAYSQRDPLNEYRREAFELFEALLGRLRETVTSVLTHVEIRTVNPADMAPPPRPVPMQETRQDPALVGADADPAPAAPSGSPVMAMARPNGPAARPAGGAAAAAVATKPRMPESQFGKVPRNAPCPCGSGKKFKQCHGKVG